MKSSALKTVLSLIVLVSLQVNAWAERIREEEVKYQTQNFKHWWETDLEWRFDELPIKGGVSAERVPYAGFEYPDRGGGTTNVLRKYDRAFHNGRSLAANYEEYDIRIHSTVPGGMRSGGGGRGLFGLARISRTPAPPHWSGHCNGWVAAAIRHAEPERNVVRNGVVFTPADIKGLMAELYMYTETEFLGGVDPAINPALLHVIVSNWVGRGKHPIGMETSVGPEVWNYPIYAYSGAFAKRGDREVEVKMNVGYVKSLGREYDRAPENFRYMYFHYTLDLNEKGEIIGGSYYRDSNRIDMLWAPQKAVPGGQKGNEKGNPHLNVKEVLALWRDSVPEEKRKNWWNIDPTDEDRIVVPESEETTPAPEKLVENSAEATETPAEATESPTEATESPTEATESPTEATESPTEATETTTGATETQE